MYQCDMSEKSYSTKYNLINHMRTKHNITTSSQEVDERRQIVKVNQFEQIDNPLEEIQDYIFEDISDTELIDALNCAEFNYIIETMEDDFEVSKTNSQEENKTKKYEKRILILAKEKALLVKKLKKVEEKNRKQVEYIRNKFSTAKETAPVNNPERNSVKELEAKIGKLEQWKEKHEDYCNSNFVSKNNNTDIVSRADFITFQEDVKKMLKEKKSKDSVGSSKSNIIDITEEDDIGGTSSRIFSCNH